MQECQRISYVFQDKFNGNMFDFLSSKVIEPLVLQNYYQNSFWIYRHVKTCWYPEYFEIPLKYWCLT